MIPMSATAGVASIDSRDAPSVPGVPRATRGTGAMQICRWQYGRVLFHKASSA